LLIFVSHNFFKRNNPIPIDFIPWMTDLALTGGGLLLLLGLLEHLLDDLLLLDQESTDDAVLNAVTAARTTVGTRDVLARTGDLSIFTRAEGGDLNLIVRPFSRFI
jgi:hypothetical protein